MARHHAHSYRLPLSTFNLQLHPESTIIQHLLSPLLACIFVPLLSLLPASSMTRFSMLNSTRIYEECHPRDIFTPPLMSIDVREGY